MPVSIQFFWVREVALSHQILGLEATLFSNWGEEEGHGLARDIARKLCHRRVCQVVLLCAHPFWFVL